MRSRQSCSSLSPSRHHKDAGRYHRLDTRFKLLSEICHAVKPALSLAIMTEICTQEEPFPGMFHPDSRDEEGTVVKSTFLAQVLLSRIITDIMLATDSFTLG